MLHWRKISSTNPQVRVNTEIKRRIDVVCIFQHDASVLRLVTAVPFEQREDWEVAERCYLSEDSMALIDAELDRETDNMPMALANTA